MNAYFNLHFVLAWLLKLCNTNITSMLTEAAEKLLLCCSSARGTRYRFAVITSQLCGGSASWWNISAVCAGGNMQPCHAIGPVCGVQSFASVNCRECDTIPFGLLPKVQRMHAFVLHIFVLMQILSCEEDGECHYYHILFNCGKKITLRVLYQEIRQVRAHKHSLTGTGSDS